MRVFMSHSSTQKAFVEALIQNCPPSIRFWVDAKDIKTGEDFKSAIDTALDEDCSFCVLIVDDNAAKSDWVGYEIDRILAREKEEGGVLLLPVVLSTTAWDEIAPRIGTHRNYILCYDQLEDGIRLTANRLTNAILAWLVENVGTNCSRTSRGRKIGAYVEAEATFLTAARALKHAIYPFRQQSPATVAVILERVSQSIPGLFTSEPELRKALIDLTHQGHLSGYYFDGETAYLVNERFHDKASIKIETKKHIAKMAAQMVSDDQIIALDGGTTTLAIASELCIRLAAGALFGLRVVTNSIPVAEAFIETLALKSANDRGSSCQVTLLGGVCRASSMCTTLDERDATSADRLQALNIAFVGASGLVGAEGFGVTHLPEVAAKKAFQAGAEKTVMVCDAMKFDVSQVRLTNPPTPLMSIITEHSASDRIEALRQANPAWDAVDVRFCD